MLQSGQNNLLARLLDLASKEDFIENGVDLVKVEYKVQFADIAEELIEYFDEKMDCFEICKLVIIGVYADAEEETRIPPVDNLGGRQILTNEGLTVSVRG